MGNRIPGSEQQVPRGFPEEEGLGRNLDQEAYPSFKVPRGRHGEDKGPMRLSGLCLPGQCLCACSFCISGAHASEFSRRRFNATRALLCLIMDSADSSFPHSFHSPQSCWLQIPHPLSQVLPKERQGLGLAGVRSGGQGFRLSYEARQGQDITLVGEGPSLHEVASCSGPRPAAG